MSSDKLLKNKLIFSLDVDDPQEAKKWIDKFASLVGAIKLGPRLVLRSDSNFVKEVSKKTSVFLDFKFFDIPSTMLGAIRAAFDQGASLVTVHGLSGPQTLLKIKELEDELSQIRPFKILCVSLLTSFSQENLPQSLSSKPLTQSLHEIVKEVYLSGLRGIVASAQEVKALKSEFKNLYCITPGVRAAHSRDHDQSRVATVTQAIQWGSDGLVIGRPILEAKNPEQVIADFLNQIEEAEKVRS